MELVGSVRVCAGAVGIHHPFGRWKASRGEPTQWWLTPFLAAPLAYGQPKALTTPYLLTIHTSCSVGNGSLHMAGAYWKKSAYWAESVRTDMYVAMDMYAAGSAAATVSA